MVNFRNIKKIADIIASVGTAVCALLKIGATIGEMKSNGETIKPEKVIVCAFKEEEEE